MLWLEWNELEKELFVSFIYLTFHSGLVWSLWCALLKDCPPLPPLYSPLNFTLYSTLYIHSFYHSDCSCHTGSSSSSPFVDGPVIRDTYQSCFCPASWQSALPCHSGCLVHVATCLLPHFRSTPPILPLVLLSITPPRWATKGSPSFPLLKSSAVSISLFKLFNAERRATIPFSYLRRPAASPFAPCVCCLKLSTRLNLPTYLSPL